MSFFSNPFPMRGRIVRCWLFSYRCDPAEVRPLVPKPLLPVAYGGFAFWNVVLCRVDHMRPLFAPKALGISCWHVAYRIPVRLHSAGRELEGLYFVRSDCDSSLIGSCGNLLTDFRFHRAGVKVVENSRKISAEIFSAEAPARIILDRRAPDGPAPGSPFPDLDFADRFLKYKPAALAAKCRRVQALRVKRDEKLWKNRLLRVEKADWDFFRDRKVVLEICQEVEPIDYQWNPPELVG